MERNYIKEKKAAVKEFDDKKVELKENLIAELEEKKKMIENEKLTMELTGGEGAGVIINQGLGQEKRAKWVKLVSGYFSFPLYTSGFWMKLVLGVFAP